MATTGDSQAANGNAISPAATSFRAPHIDLPKGGGAIRGIGEKFSANASTGTSSLSIPIAASEARSGFTPQLSIAYDSGGGNGPFGVGWMLSTSCITRKTDKGLPQYRDGVESDVFILSGSEDLVPELHSGDGRWSESEFEQDGYRIKRYRPRIEGLFARIERWTRVRDGEIHWRSFSNDNVLTLYGASRESRIFDPNDPGHIFSWLISASFDGKGNAIAYEYVAEDERGVDLTLANERNRIRTANRYLKRIKYGNRRPVHDFDLSGYESGWMFELVFDYGDADYEVEPVSAAGDVFVAVPEDAGCGPDAGCRPWPVRADAFSRYRSGFEIRTYRLCRRVLQFHCFPQELGTLRYLTRSTGLEYRQQRIGAFLIRAIQSGYTRVGECRYLKKSLPALEMAYSASPLEDEAAARDYELKDAVATNLPEGIDGRRYRWLDLDGVGISGVLTEQGSEWYYNRNLGHGRFGTAELVTRKPAGASLEGSSQQLLDIAGDGNLDLVELAHGAAGFYERPIRGGGWEPFRAFRDLPVLDWDDPNLRFVDITGDGVADVLITEDSAYKWHPSRLWAGFGAQLRVPAALNEEQGPRVVFDDGTESIYLADMSGDGLPDIVRIRNGEVCYWPNRGYGRFGAKVTMDDAPWFDTPDSFDQKRIRLADTDGSGTTDILYIGSHGVDVFLNQSGSGWSQRRTLENIPTGDLTSISVADFLGRGTSCLVWSSPLPSDASRALRYVDLMRGQKPHLLTHIRNNLGAETTLEYASSTEFYLADEAAGNPWITRLPFPVQVVKRIETRDRVSRNRFVSHRTYHHGFFDGIEREFRGFGRVEQLDTEDLAVLDSGQETSAASNELAAWNVPPVLTKTWFHTGVFLGGGRVSHQLAHEYYQQPNERTQGLLEDTVLPDDLTAEEAREACRSLKGSMLRQEIYALDGMEESARPYTASEANMTIRLVQPREWNRHAILYPHARESIVLNYERKLYNIAGTERADPRVLHTVTLRVDDYGNVLKEARIAYGRRWQQPSALESDSDRRKQEQTLVTYTESDYTGPVREPNAYRNPLQAESRVYELYNLRPAPGQPNAPHRFTFGLLSQQIASAGDGRHDLAYEVMNGTGAFGGAPCRRLFQRTRTVYRSNDLARLLPAGELQSLALPGEMYRLAFTPGVITGVFRRQESAVEHLIPDARRVLIEGGYVDLEGNGHWWVPSGRVFYSAEPEDSSAVELAQAHEHFFLPRRYRDSFGNNSRVTYDIHDLTVAVTRDAAGNTIKSLTDYRVLAPRLVTDANGNRAAAAFDALGMVVGTAMMGKQGEGEGDSLDGFVADLSEREILEHCRHPLRDPHRLLAGATTRVVYDLFAFARTQDAPRPQPSVACLLARETHESALAHGERTRVQQSFTYSDGFQRISQSKKQASPGPLFPGGPAADPRWIGTGWTIFNNKGDPVRKYEPFFSDSHEFEFARMAGVSSTLFYDPLGRTVATLHPEHTYEKVVFDPWQQVSWDVSDTVLEQDPELDADIGGFFRRIPRDDYLPTWYTQRKEGGLGQAAQEAALQAAGHARTPKHSYLDPLGRSFLTIELNRTESNGQKLEQKIATRTEFDIEGQPLFVVDGAGHCAAAYAYDLLSNQIFQNSADAGARWILPEITQKPLRAWDSRGYEFRYGYDALRRQTHWFSRHDGGREKLAEKIIYGEGAPNDLRRNLRGKTFRHLDGAGVAGNEAFDFKGNLLHSSRELARDYHDQIDWQSSPELEERVFRSSTTYDALNRPVTVTTPDETVTRLHYNLASLPERVEANLQGAELATRFVTNIEYNARSQRELIAFGNGTRTRYAYDPMTFRLAHLETTRAGHHTRLQDLAYTYDPVGNITSISDHAQQTTWFDNQVVSPHRHYAYDALYRLITAQGREHIGCGAAPQSEWDRSPWASPVLPADGAALRRYKEEYRYDVVGNILEMIHHAGNGGWRRHLEYASNSNRLERGRVGDCVERYGYDANGNILHMPHLSLLSWNFRNQLASSGAQRVNHGEGERTYYVYDSAGVRVRKVTERPDGSRAHERIYLGNFEIYRQYGRNKVVLERQTLHIMDNERRIALVETKTIDARCAPSEWLQVLTRYQLTDHLDSSCLELDEDAAIISYEEYSPYGSTSYEAVRRELDVSPKRYRFAAQERDEETGFYLCTMRYYAPWLGRWTSSDPAGLSAGINSYCYVSDNPLSQKDPSGLGFWGHVWGGVKAIGGGLEVVAGVAVTGVGAAASEIGIGVPIAGLGLVIIAHGADTTQAGVRQTVTGDPTDTITSTELQEHTSLTKNQANLVDAGIGLLFTLGGSAAARAPEAAGVTLSHLTSTGAAADINLAQTLGKGGTIYAGTAALGNQAPLVKTLLTGLPASKTAAVIEIPFEANQAFRIPTVVGPMSGWQRATGAVYSAGAGTIDLATGTANFTGPALNQWFVYGIDSVINGGLRTGAELGNEQLGDDPSGSSAPQASSSILLNDPLTPTAAEQARGQSLLNASQPDEPLFSGGTADDSSQLACSLNDVSTVQ